MFLFGAGGLGGREDAMFTDITESIHIHKNSMNIFVCFQYDFFLFVCFSPIFGLLNFIRTEKCEHVSSERFKERSQKSRMTYRILTEDDTAEGVQKDLKRFKLDKIGHMEEKSGLEIVCSHEINCGHGLGILFSKYCEVLGRRNSKYVLMANSQR